jgi:hypothetical protein
VHVAAHYSTIRRPCEGVLYVAAVLKLNFGSVNVLIITHVPCLSPGNISTMVLLLLWHSQCISIDLISLIIVLDKRPNAPTIKNILDNYTHKTQAYRRDYIQKRETADTTITKTMHGKRKRWMG